MVDNDLIAKRYSGLKFRLRKYLVNNEHLQDQM
jgi:hypothetical protein